MAYCEVAKLSVFRGPIEVVHEVSLQLEIGAVVAVSGPNGAGKTTLLEGLAGLHPCAGALSLDGRPVDLARAPSTASQGIALSPDGRHLFPSLTVGENLLLGGFPLGRRAAAESVEAMVVAVPWLGDRMGQRAGTLSGGEQQLVATCRALVAGPKLLLLDSPTSGLGPRFRDQVAALVRHFVSGGARAVIVADDNDEFLAEISTRQTTMSGGRFT